MKGSVKVVLSALSTTVLLIGGAVTVLAHPAMITTDPRSGPPGSGTNVLGDYFGEGVPVQIHWGSASGPVLGTGIGPAFYIHVTTPANAAAGSYSIVAVGQDNTGTVVQNAASFTVADPAPAPATPARVAPVAHPQAAVIGTAPGRGSSQSRQAIPPLQSASPVNPVVVPTTAPAVEKADALGMTRALSMSLRPSSATTVVSPSAAPVQGRAAEGGSLFAKVVQTGWTKAIALGLVIMMLLAVLRRQLPRTGSRLADNRASESHAGPEDFVKVEAGQLERGTLFEGLTTIARVREAQPESERASGPTTSRAITIDLVEDARPQEERLPAITRR